MEGEEPAINTCAYNREDMVEGGKTKQAENSFLRHFRKLWNRSPTEIKEAPTEGAVKRLIKSSANCYLSEGKLEECKKT